MGTGSETPINSLYQAHEHGNVLPFCFCGQTAFTLPDWIAKTFTASAFAVGRFFLVFINYNQRRLEEWWDRDKTWVKGQYA